MENLILEPTVKSPLFEFSPKGLLVIEGKAIDEETDKAFKPAIEWCRNVNTKDIYLFVKLDFMNMASMKQMHNLFMALRNNETVNSVVVSWYFDKEDIEMYDIGKIFQEVLEEFKFQFICI